MLGWVRQQRPNSKWVLEKVTNVTFFVAKLRNHTIGRGKFLPHYIVENRGFVPLDCNKTNGKSYNDNICFFQALALHNGCHLTNLECDTQHYYKRYRATRPDDKEFRGVKLEEILDLELLFEVIIFVYLLEPTKPDGDDDDDTYNDDNQPEITAQLVHRSLSHYSSTLYLNLYGQHFSYIKDLSKFTKSFCCFRCGKFWKTANMLRRHERKCEEKVHYKFPGGAYKNPSVVATFRLPAKFTG